LICIYILTRQVEIMIIKFIQQSIQFILLPNERIDIWTWRS
jgi:hypothetical protein